MASERPRSGADADDGNPVDEIRRLYYRATRKTIERDLARAIELLKRLPDEESRQRVAVYMDGLSQMRSEWAAKGKGRF